MRKRYYSLGEDNTFFHISFVIGLCSTTVDSLIKVEGSPYGKVASMNFFIF